MTCGPGISCGGSVLPRSSTTEKSTSTWNQVACYSPIYPNPMLGQLPLHSLPLLIQFGTEPNGTNRRYPWSGLSGLYPRAVGSLVTTILGNLSSLIVPCDPHPTATAGCTLRLDSGFMLGNPADSISNPNPNHPTHPRFGSQPNSPKAVVCLDA